MRQRIPLIIYAAVVLLMLWIGFDFYRTYTSSATTAPPELALDMAPASPERPRKPLAYYAIIGGRGLFCMDCSDESEMLFEEEPGSPQPQEGALANKLRLLGTAVAQDGEDYTVLEHLSTREQRLYKVGDVAEGAKIVEIEPNRVTVSYGVKVETLIYIPEEPARRPAPQKGPQAKPGPLSKPGQFGRAVSRDDVAECAEMIDSLLAKAGAEAFSKGDQPYGLRLARVDVRSCLGRMGLRSGDIILSMNEKAITSVSDAADALAYFVNAQSLHFRVDRNGWPRTFSLQVQ